MFHPHKAVDLATRTAGVAVNCEHAISDIVRNPGEPFERTGTAHGHWGSFLVAGHLRSWMIEPTVVHEWLNGALGLDAYPIARKGWSQTDSTYRSSPFTFHAVAIQDLARPWRG